MDKEEIDRLIYELNELSEFEEQNKERMKEIAHILVTYYMWWWKTENKSNVKNAENELKLKCEELSASDVPTKNTENPKQH